MDSLARAGREDLLIAMTFDPYRMDVVETVRFAQSLGLKIVVLTDSWRCPIVVHADHTLLVPVDTPRFFASSVALTALIELLVALAFKKGGRGVAEKVKPFHAGRFERGICWAAEE